MRIVGELFEEQNKNIGRALRGVDRHAVVATEDIEAQMMIKTNKNSGPKAATQGGVLIKDDGFEGFHTLHDRHPDADAPTNRQLTDFETQAID